MRLMAGFCGDRGRPLHVAFLLHEAAGDKRKTKEISEIARHHIEIAVAGANYVLEGLPH